MKIEISVQTNKIGSMVTKAIEIDDEDLADLAPDERSAMIDQIAQEELLSSSLISWDWRIVPEPDK